MADNKKDPSGLYDDDFLEKKEATLAEDADSDIASKGDEEKQAFDGETQESFKQEEAFDRGFDKAEFEEAFSDDDDDEEKEGFFSRLSKKRKRKASHEIIKAKKADYDIFDLDNLIEQEEKAKKEAPKKAVKEAEKEDAVEQKKKAQTGKKKKAEPPKAQKKKESPQVIKKQRTEKELGGAEKPSAEDSFDDSREIITKDSASHYSEDESFKASQPNQTQFSPLSSDSERNLDDDIDALLQSVGIEPLHITQTPVNPQPSYAKPQEPQFDFQEQEKTELSEDTVVGGTKKAEDENLNNTRHFKLDKNLTAQLKSEETVAPVPVFEDTIHFVPVSENTMHFTPVKKILEQSAKQQEEPVKKSQPEKPEKKKGFMENFRVLASGNKGDKPILEQAPKGKGRESILDNVAPVKGENLFDAVEKAEKKKKSAAGKFKLGGTVKSIQQKAKTQRKREAFQNLTVMRNKLGGKISRQKRMISLCTVVLGISLILFILPFCYTPGNSLEFLFGSGSTVYIILNIVTLGLMCIAGFDVLKNAIGSLRYLTANGNVCFLMVMLFVLLHDIVLLSRGDFADTGSNLYTLVACFAMFIRLSADYISTESQASNIRSIIKSGELESMQPIDNKADAASLGYGISDDGEPKIFYCADVDIPQSIENDEMPQKQEKYYAYSCIGVLFVGIVLGIICALRSDDNVTFITTLVSCICILAPFMKDLATAMISNDIGRKLNASGVAVTSLNGAAAVGNATAVTVDVREIFSGDVSSFRRVASGNMSLSDAAVFTASALKGSKSILTPCFKDFLSQSKIELPVAEDVQYEEKLGISCWIADSRVLVGNRAMLIQHSIDAPTKEQEKAYAKKKKCMYVVVDGKLVATFLVSYKVKSDIKKHIGFFNQTGLVLMLTSNEPCLTQEIIASMMGAEVAAIKLCSGKSSDIISEYRHNPAVRKENGLFCSRKRRNVLLLINGAYGLFVADKMVSIINIAGQCFFLILMLLAAMLNISSLFNPAIIILLQLCWSAVNIFISKKRGNQ